ncbi:DUF4241 domain-containing protein [Streptomyces sp. NPDC058052]|uniref:DUF4241 domain-containing protein n=1 Tax=Streptomyces sp. NPDC058052 TaxID=3346316 RepID=UPI0036E2910C
MFMTPPDFAHWFTPGAVVPTEDRRDVVFGVREVGELDLPSGRLVACDPIVHLCHDDERPEPFAVTVPPGRYRVQTAEATFTYPVDHTVNAAARLVIRDTPVVRWEPALVPGEAEPGDDSFGFGVDAGAGCFLDTDAHHSFPGTDDDSGVVWEGLDADTPGPTAFVAEGENGHTIAVFASGWGDGLYPTWVGRDADGEAACFVVDLRPFRFARTA